MQKRELDQCERTEYIRYSRARRIDAEPVTRIVKAVIGFSLWKDTAAVKEVVLCLFILPAPLTCQKKPSPSNG